MNNNYYYMLHLFLLWVCSLVFTDLFANTSQINRHVMHYGTQLNWYDEYDEYFIRYTGFKKSDPNQDPISNIRIINGASDTIFINKITDS